MNNQLLARIADFFDTPLDRAFAKTADGREVVYPWPWQHKGYMLPDRETAQRLRATMQWWVRMALPIFVMFAMFGLPTLLRFAAFYLAAYYVTIWSQVNRFAPAGRQIERLASEEENQVSA
ncbi:MAG TPA: hypothetical protein VEF07_06180 [Candidatus Binataceae bacterium]|nr:hypothetical protein [Candidatus Binataceae bacterium]